MLVSHSIWIYGVFYLLNQHGMCIKRFYKDTRLELTRQSHFVTFFLFLVLFFVQQRTFPKKIFVSFSFSKLSNKTKADIIKSTHRVPLLIARWRFYSDIPNGRWLYFHVWHIVFLKVESSKRSLQILFMLVHYLI
jgi:hypothetical protein